MFQFSARQFLLLLTGFVPFLVQAQPANDLCSAASTLTTGTSCSVTAGNLYNATATGSPTSSCGTTNDVWYSFTLPVSSSIATIEVTPTGNSLTTSNTFFQAFSGSACSPTAIGSCTNGGTPLVLTGLTGGQTYHVRVFTNTTPSTTPTNRWNFNICVTHTPPPANDDCSGAVALTSGTALSGTVWAATATGGIPVDCATGTPDDDVWYSFIAGNPSASVTLSGLGSNLSSSGARMQLFSGSCGTLTAISCGTTSLSASGLTAGQTYLVRVYSAGAGSIGGTSAGSAFTITAVSPYRPLNDEPSGAIELPTNFVCTPARGTLTNASTTSGITPACATGTPDDDVWFRFTATKSNPSITLTNIASSITTTGGGSRVQLFSGTPGALTSMACGTTSISASGLTTGATYYLRVYSFNSAALSSATFDVCVVDPAPVTVTDSTTALFNMDTVGVKLSYPWEITPGPDDSLWLTEARGYRILRMSTGRTEAAKNVAPQEVLRIPLGSSQVNFDRSIGSWPQGGMQGLAIHPEFMTDPAKRWVYVAYVYNGTCPSGPSSPCYFRSKIIQCRFYFAADAGNPTSVPKRDTLVIIDTLISNLPGSNDHNSGRLTFGPVKEGPDNTYKLYYTIGDMGAGQFNNATRPMHALNRDTCEGKILRLNSEPDTDVIPGTPAHDFQKWIKWIPNDNPFTHSLITGMRTPVYTIGHRNPQGIIWGQVNGTWRLYSSEHGDKSDDEINILYAGKNYGWPRVSGFADDNYSAADNSPNGYTKNDVLAGQTITSETSYSSVTPDYTDPMFSFFNWNAAQIETITGSIFTWPTIGASGLDFYSSNRIPGWRNSLLVPSLKYGLYRLKLNATGDGVEPSSGVNPVDTFPLLHGWRVRDVAISSDGGTIWAVIDSTGSTSGPTGGFGGTSSTTRDGGKVLRLVAKNVSILPAQFLSFDARLVRDGEVDLQWRATIDGAHHFFEVERSDDGRMFSAIGRVERGSANFWTDPAPRQGVNYYRIRQVDLDGRSVYTRIIPIYVSSRQLDLQLFPNPAQSVVALRMRMKQPEPLIVAVQDLTGRTVYTSSLLPATAQRSLQIDLRRWSPGTYQLVVRNARGVLLVAEKFVRQ